MALIAILLAIFVERFLGSLEELRRFEWFSALVTWVRGLSWSDGPGGVALAVALPVFAVFLVNHFLAALWWPLAFLFALLVLLYCFGPKDLEAEVEAFLDARERGDEESACLHANDLLGTSEVDNSRRLTRAVLQTVLVEANERFLGVIFWFVVLGPTGALLYRLACQLNSDFAGNDAVFAVAVRRLHHILEWVPARLTALGYALSGSFVDAMHYWRHDAAKWQEDGRGILVASGFGALRYQPVEDDDSPVDIDEENSYIREALAMVRRAVLVWLAVLALLTLAGWAG